MRIPPVPQTRFSHPPPTRGISRTTAGPAPRPGPRPGAARFGPVLCAVHDAAFVNEGGEEAFAGFSCEIRRDQCEILHIDDSRSKVCSNETMTDGVIDFPVFIRND